jgi:hypothetical protein
VAAPVPTADDFVTASLKLIAEKKYEDVEAGGRRRRTLELSATMAKPNFAARSK